MGPTFLVVKLGIAREERGGREKKERDKVFLYVYD